jgi:general secretion pathway protein N
MAGAGIEMKPGRAISLLTGVALLSGIAKFNEMTPDAQAQLLGDAADTARTAAQSLLSTAVTTYGQMTATTDAASPQPPAAQPATTREIPPRENSARQNPPRQDPPRQVAVRTADAAETPPSGNPLWAMPLKQLSMTRDRPVFSPSRRPPPPPAPAFVAPVAVRQPVKPAEPEKPAVSLLGTIIGAGADDRIGVFLETGTQTIVRLRIGEDHQGWVLRLIKAREVTLVKDREQAVVLELPAPGDSPPPLGYGGIPPMPGVIPGMPGAIPNGALPIPAQQRQGGRRQQGK